ncbi:MAG: serine/threonine protein kinase/Tol biopolymer transport system component, partial [Candidatus Krumholzibacteriia bacterium]
MQPGDKLAHYEIKTPLGKGGMGEVFLATDTKLGRDVALKILPAELAQDAERLARFKREAQVLAALNHPNISAIYGIEKDGNHLFLAMELAKGQDLSQRLANGPIPMNEALAIAQQIAAGMAEAHDKGIIHRDLKPANVMADADGTVKVLDFGLARAHGGDDETDDGSGGSSFSPTITAAMTQPGTVMGTAAYMSPEQARGQTAGKQSDIWAFGCLLFEMLTGHRIFAGATVSDSVAAILKNDPSWELLPAATPPSVVRMLHRCLERDKLKRLRDIGDAWIEIEDALSGGEEFTTGETLAQKKGSSRFIWPGICGGLVAAVVVVFLLGKTDDGQPTTNPPPRIAQLVQLTDLTGEQTEPSLSPDGRTLAYSTWDDGDQDIFVQRVGGANPINLTAGHPGLDATPAFSPDGEKIAFHSDREGGGLFVMGATGETPLKVVSEGVHPCWSPDGTSLAYTTEYITIPYSRNNAALLWVTDLETGVIRQLTDIDAVVPSWSPSGKRIAFWSHLATVMGQRDIYTIAADGGKPVAVTLDNATDWSPQWSPDGRWIYFISDRGGTPDLWRVGIDENTGETTSEPEAVTAGMTRISKAAVSTSGSIALTSTSTSGEIFSIGFDTASEAFTGQPTTLLTSAHAFTQISVAFDGSLVAYRTTAPEEHIYVMAPDGSDRRRLLADEHRNRGPRISPDNRWVIFYSNRSGSYDIWAIRTDGTGLKPVTAEMSIDFNDPVWRADGRLFAHSQAEETSLVEINLPAGGLDALDSPAALTNLTQMDAHNGFRVSPDNSRESYSDLNRNGQLFTRKSGAMEWNQVMIDGEQARVIGGVDWLDNDRILFWDSFMKQTILWNAATGSAKSIPGIDGEARFGFAAEGRQVFVNRTVKRSDIWLLT